MSYTYQYPRPAVTADIIVTDFRDSPGKILLIQRKHEPFKEMWALPGGFMNMDETLEEAARRELREETGIEANRLVKFDTYDRPGRDPRRRTVTQVFTLAWRPELGRPAAGDDAKEERWFGIHQLPPLAFDHDEVIVDFLQSLKK